MGNRVKQQHGIIIITQSGNQTYESISSITAQVEKLSIGLDEVKILVDHHRLGKLDIGARQAGLEVARHLKFQKMALYGATPYITGLINLLARSMGRQHQIHMTKTREEALQWLK